MAAIASQIVLGIVLAIAFIAFARRGNRRSESGFYALGLAVAALIYVVFAALGGDLTDLLSELLGLIAFAIVAAFAWWRDQPMILAIGWTVHAGWDALQLGAVTYVPGWYTIACLGFDLLLAFYIGRSLRRPSPAPALER